MVVLIHQFVHPSPLLVHHLPLPRLTRAPISITKSSSSSSSMMNTQNNNPRFMEFPHLSIPHRNLMVDLVSTMENTLSSQLLPSSLPPDIQYFENETSTSEGSLYIRSGNQDSSVNCVLGSWIYSKLPTGGAINITSLISFPNSRTDSPSFIIEFIQSKPTSLILIIDLPPRKDLVINKEYLKYFYEETNLDQGRKKLQELTEVCPYISPSLFARCLLSPTGISVTIDCESGGGVDRMDEIIQDHVGPIAKGILDIWLKKFVGIDREMDELEKVELEKRDGLIRKETVEMDLGNSLPRLFGLDVANKLIKTIEKAFNI